MRSRHYESPMRTLSRRGTPALRAFLAAICLGGAIILAMVSCSPEEPLSLIPPGHASWKRTTSQVLDYPVPGHEDNLRVIRMNDTGFAYTITADDGLVFPEGTILTKDVYMGRSPADGAQPVMVTAMVKAPSDSRARGGWVWVVKDTKTGRETVQTGDFCVRCHHDANEKHPYGQRNPDAEFRDYVFMVPER